ncbi:MAG: hypothetical protein HOD18_03030 [Candidatus Marinimicrobia bacterium]|nr:hypothetical protein [Candidatus Neomarinimicrobiota bacterium]
MNTNIYMAVKRICCILTIILSILSAQKERRFAYELFSSMSKEIKADAGKDIQAPPSTTILLDASHSTPKKALQRYEWSFEEGIIFQDDYIFNETDSVILYEFNQDTIGITDAGQTQAQPVFDPETGEPIDELGLDERISIKKVITKNKFIEVVLPEMPVGTKFPVVLKVVDLKGSHDSDLVWIKITDLNEYDEDYTHTEEFLEDGDVTDPKDEALIYTTKDEQQDHLLSKVNLDYISIQPINKGLLKAMEVEIINAFLFNETQKLGFDKVINPNRFIPDSIQTLKLVERVRFDIDTLINIEKKSSRPGIDLSASNIIVLDTLIKADTVINSSLVPFDINALPVFDPETGEIEDIDTSGSSGAELDTTALSGLITDNTDFLSDDSVSIADTLEDKSKALGNLFSEGNQKYNQKYMKRVVTDTTIAIDSMIVYETIDTSITLDTLMYSETVDTVLYYNFNCINDSCAAENALLEGVGQVLTWGINEFSQLEVHFFDASSHLNNEPLRVWTSSPVVLNPDISEKLHYPEALAITDDGKLLVAAANDQTVYELNLNQDASTLIENKVLGEKLLHPSGIDVGPNGKVYVSDRDNHRMFSVLGNYFESLLSPRKNKDGSISKGQAFFPTKITVGPGGDIYVLYEGNDSVVKVDKNYDRSLVLQPSIVNGIRDIAVNSKDSVFVVSPSSNMVYQVINDSTVIAVAGMDETDGMVKNNIKATDSFLGLPVAIDFDSADQLYIGDNKFGLVRRVDSLGIITTLFGINNKIDGIGDLRVSKGSSPNIFISQPLEHQIQRISLDRVFPWRAETKINSPKYIIEKNGVYGLESEIGLALSTVLKEKLTMPEEKKTIVEKLKEKNQRLSDYIKKRPILFALLLILINQSISANIDLGVDLPPDFPGF